MQLTNEFSVTRIDLDTFDYPKVEVQVWSSLTRPGGSVDIEARTPEGARLTLYSETIEENRSVIDERDYAQELADDWNNDCEDNWRQEILRCLKYIANYEQKEIDRLQDHKDKLESIKASIKRMEDHDNEGQK